MGRPAPGAHERAAGYSLIELMVVVGLLTVVLAVSVPLFHNFYSRTRVSSSAAMVQSLVQKARMSALKEKNSFRVVVHDENASTPNTLELQREQSGSFVTVAGETHTVPEGVRILGASPSDSMDNVTVTGRGECSSGSVYVYADGVDVGVVTIAATCYSDAS